MLRAIYSAVYLSTGLPVCQLIKRMCELSSAIASYLSEKATYVQDTHVIQISSLRKAPYIFA